MNAKSQSSRKPWVDPDDAPEITEEVLAHAVWRDGERIVTPGEGAAALRKAVGRGRPPVASPKRAVTVRYDAEVIEAFRSTGKGWQTRMNEALKEWLRGRAT